MLSTSLRPPLSRVLNPPFNSVDGGPTAFLDFMNGRLDSRITFTRADASTCASYFNSAGVASVAAANIPRFDYDPVTLAAKGLLIEESRQNIFLNSLLDGTSLSTQSPTVTAVPWTLSFTGTGTVTMTGAFAGSLVGSGAAVRVQSTFTPSAGALTCTVTGTVKWANLEIGAFASSFIPTAGAPITRAADVAVNTTLGNIGFNAVEGSIMVEFMPMGMGSANFPGTICFDDGTNANAIDIFVNDAGDDKVYLDVEVASVAQCAITIGGAATAGAIIKAATSWKANSFRYAVNGLAGTEDTAGSIPTVNRMRVGAARGGGNYMNGWIRRAKYYPSQFTTAQLQAMTQ